MKYFLCVILFLKMSDNLVCNLTFDLYVILTGLCRRFHPMWAGVSMIIGSKVVSLFNKCPKPSEAIIARMVWWTSSV